MPMLFASCGGQDVTTRVIASLPDRTRRSSACRGSSCDSILEMHWETVSVVPRLTSFAPLINSFHALTDLDLGVPTNRPAVSTASVASRWDPSAGDVQRTYRSPNAAGHGREHRRHRLLHQRLRISLEKRLGAHQRLFSERFHKKENPVQGAHADTSSP